MARERTTERGLPSDGDGGEAAGQQRRPQSQARPLSGKGLARLGKAMALGASCVPRAGRDVAVVEAVINIEWEAEAGAVTIERQH